MNGVRTSTCKARIDEYLSKLVDCYTIGSRTVLYWDRDLSDAIINSQDTHINELVSLDMHVQQNIASTRSAIPTAHLFLNLSFRYCFEDLSYSQPNMISDFKGILTVPCWPQS